MKRLFWAALAALTFLSWSAAPASAGDGFGFQFQICCHRGRVYVPCPSICGLFCGCGCGQGHGGCGCGICNPYAFNQCAGLLPGPWYTFWPAPGSGVMTSNYIYPNWRYDDNFLQVAAPPPYGYGNAPVAGIGAMPGAFQTVGYYPSYWYPHP
jgi:hypothetical protein